MKIIKVMAMRDFCLSMHSLTRYAVLLSSLVLMFTAASLQALAAAGASPTLSSGQSATLLPDGQWLLLGGDGGKASNDAWLFGSRRGHPQTLKAKLSQSRTDHSATILPDGRVLILGGRGADGALVRQAEVFRPAEKRFEVLKEIDLTPRAGHNATVLTDGRVLIVGGVDREGRLLRHAELWNPRSGQKQTLTYSDSFERRDAVARMMPDGNVLYVRGTGSEGKPAEAAFQYRSSNGHFEEISSDVATRKIAAVEQATASKIVATLPSADAEDFLPDGTIALRFSAPLDVTTLNEHTVFLMGPHGAVQANIVPAQDGMLLFITPKIPLLPGARHTLFLDGVVGAGGVPLGFQTLDFGTVTLGANESPAAETSSASKNGAARRLTALPAGKPFIAGADVPNAAAVDDEVFVPGPEHHGGRWRSGRALPYDLVKRINHALAEKGALAYEHEHKKKRKPPKLRRATPAAESGTPGVTGQVLRLNDKPLSNVNVSIGTRSTRTDAKGYFSLRGVPTGRQELFVDGTQGGAQGRQYGKFVIGVDMEAGKTTQVPPIFLPRIRAQDWIPISSPLTQDRVITHPNVPGMEIHIPQGAVLRERDGKLVTRIALIPIPLDRIPFAFPENAPVYVSVQPGGLIVQGLSPKTTQGIRVIYPNLSNEPAGGPADFWRYDPGEKGWYIYGQGHASADAKQIVPDPGVAVYESIGFMYTPPPPTPPPPDGPKQPDICRGDPVSCSSGLFLHHRTDVTLPDIMPLRLSHTYRPGDNVNRSFGFGAAHPYALSLYLPPTGSFQSAQLVRPTGGTVTFTRVTPGTGVANAVFESQNEPSEFYKARLSSNTATNSWLLKTKDGMTYEFSYTRGIPLTALSDRHGNAITITRSGGLIQRLTTASGRYLDFTYDTANRITQLKDIAGRTWSYAYTGNHLSQVTYPDNSVEAYTYDTAGRMLTVVDRRGNTMVTNVYDSNGRVSQQTLADGGVHQFNYTLDTSGKIIQTDVTDPRASITRYVFNSAGQLISETIALGTSVAQTTTHEREIGSNLLLSVTDALGRKTAYTYDTNGNRLSKTRLAGTAQAVTETYTYEPLYHQVSSVTDALGKVTTITYDTKGNPVAIKDPLNNQTSLSYNAAGQLLSVTDALNQTTQFAYEGSDLVRVTDPLGRTTTRYLDSLGRLLAVTDPLGHRTRYRVDAFDRITQITDALNDLTQLAYDNYGNLTSLTDAKGGQTKFVYDAKNRLTTRIDPLLKSESFVYDSNDNTIQYTDRKAQVTASTYDPLNRRTQINYADASSTAFTYDDADRLTQITDSQTGAITRAYDNLDRLTQETTPQGGVGYSYDNANRRATLTVSGQPSVSYAYDTADRLTQITQGSATVQFSHDAAARRTSLTLPNGIVATYSYDSASQLTGITYKLGATLIGDLRYTYDATGNRKSAAGTLAKTNLPNPSTTASYDPAHRLTNWNGATLTYDANGNLLNDGTKTYAWDARNRLTSITGTVNASFQYDALGRRTQKTINGATTKYLYDGINPVQEQTGSTQANLLTGLNVDEYFRRTDGQGARDFLTDALGSTLALTDNTGTIQTRYTYDPYGNTTTSGQVSTNPYQYTGREKDGTGLYYYRARYYDPERQRFVSEDPIGLAGGDVNLMRYVGNNPLRWTDPLGLEILVCGRGVQGFPFVGNHGYVWDTTTNTAEGMRGSSGSGQNSSEAGPSGDSCTPVENSGGKEDQVMDFMRSNQNNGMWFPFLNDCHNAIDDALNDAGLANPGAPGGRLGSP